MKCQCVSKAAFKGRVFRQFWPTGDEDFLCVHVNDVHEILDEIERLEKIILDLGGSTQ